MHLQQKEHVVVFFRSLSENGDAVFTFHTHTAGKHTASKLQLRSFSVGHALQ